VLLGRPRIERQPREERVPFRAGKVCHCFSLSLRVYDRYNQQQHLHLSIEARNGLIRG
jgi:hypothetical protein